MRRLFITIFVFAALIVALALKMFGSSNHLTIFTWTNYIDPEIVQQFEHEYGVRIDWIYFKDDDDRDAQLAATATPQFDVVLVGERKIRLYLTRGWLEPINPQNIPTLQYISERYYTFIPEIKGYAAPYFWGTTGIVYRSDLVKQPITRWAQLFKPAPELRGHVRMQSDFRELTASALMSAGLDPNTLNPADYQVARELVMQQAPYVWGYRTLVTDTAEPIVTTNEIYVAPTFNGDALSLKSLKPTLKYLVPEEGGALWIDFFVILHSAPHVDLAKQFIEFLNRPQIAAKNAQYLNYATPNEAALALLPKKLLDNKTIFPDAETITRCHMLKNLPSSIRDVVDSIKTAALSRYEKSQH